jgi:hypothetical protein
MLPEDTPPVYLKRVPTNSIWSILITNMVAVQIFNYSQQASLFVDLEHVCQNYITWEAKAYKQISE